MAAALTALANITLGSSQATVTFDSISSGYRDLMLVAELSPGSAGNHFFISVNNDTNNANYNYLWMIGQGASASSTSGNNRYIGYDGAFNIVHLLDYSTTDKHKTIISRTGDNGDRVRATTNRWASTSAVTSLVLSTSGSSFTAGSSFALYGIVNS